MKNNIINILENRVDSRRDFLLRLMARPEEDGGDEGLSPDLDGLWSRYVAARLEGRDVPVELDGGEFGQVMERRATDPRAAAIYLDLCLRILPDGSAVPESAPLSAEGRALSRIILAGIRHEAACLRYEGSIGDYPDNTLADMDEDWGRYIFAREKDAAPVPGYVRAVRADMLGIPDYSNVVELRDEPLAKAN